MTDRIASANREQEKCLWCLDSSHTTAQCPGTREWLLGPRTIGTLTPDSDADDMPRSIQYRTAKNALLGYAHAQGWEFPASIRELDPDYRWDQSRTEDAA